MFFDILPLRSGIFVASCECRWVLWLPQSVEYNDLCHFPGQDLKILAASSSCLLEQLNFEHCVWDFCRNYPETSCWRGHFNWQCQLSPDFPANPTKVPDMWDGLSGTLQGSPSARWVSWVRTVHTVRQQEHQVTPAVTGDWTCKALTGRGAAPVASQNLGMLYPKPWNCEGAKNWVLGKLGNLQEVQREKITVAHI